MPAGHFSAAKVSTLGNMASTAVFSGPCPTGRAPRAAIEMEAWAVDYQPPTPTRHISRGSNYPTA